MRDWTLQYSLLWAAFQKETVNCDCPDGYEPYNDECRKISILPTEQPPDFTPLKLVEKTYEQYSQWGVKIYDAGYNLDGTGAYTLYTQTSPASFWHNVDSVNNKDYGAMNRTGLWATTYFNNQQIGFSTCINAPVEKTYLVGFGVDNYVTIRIDGVPIMQMYEQENADTFRYWNIYPVVIKKGIHVIEVIANNKTLLAAIGAEIYNATPAQLMATTNKTQLEPYLIFSTEDLIGAYTNLGDNGYPIIDDYALVFCDGNPPFYRKVEYTPCIVAIFDGQYQTAVVLKGPIYISSDYGETWEAKLTANNWQAVSLSATGQYQTALIYNVCMYMSLDFGDTWSVISIAALWKSISLSATGQYQTAVAINSPIYISSDFGETWVTAGLSLGYNGVSVSSTGQYQTAVVYSGYIYVSSDYGTTWSQRAISKGWRSISLSSSGQYQTVCGYYYVQTSSDYGQTWTERLSTKDWYGISVSATGQYQTAVAKSGYIYVSADYGITWVTKESARDWKSVSISSTGQYQTAVAYSGYIYVSTDYGNTWSQKGIVSNYVSVSINKKSE